MNAIFLYPYAGGSVASYRSYANAFPLDAGQVTPIEIPGRGSRAHESYATTIEECAGRSLDPIITHSHAYILHGHCMGALLVFETMQHLQKAGLQLPQFIIVSGRNSPRYKTAWSQRVAGLDDKEFFAELQAIGGVPRGLNYAMSRDFLTTIRQDQAMSRDYRPVLNKLPVPILALAGNEDEMTNPDGLRDWENFTSQFITVEQMPGEHYFILERPAEVGKAIERFQSRVSTAEAAKDRANGYEPEGVSND